MGSWFHTPRYQIRKRGTIPTLWISRNALCYKQHYSAYKVTLFFLFTQK